MKIFFVLIAAFCFALLMLNGCSSPPSREAIESVEANYRPNEDKPVLPLLTPDSPFSDFITYAMLNNPNVEAAFYDWKMSVEEAVAAGSLPNPQLTLNAEITSIVESFIIGLAQELPGPGKLELQAEAVSAIARKKRFIFENELLNAAFKVNETFSQNGLLNEKISLTRQMLELADTGESSVRAGLETGLESPRNLTLIQSEQARLRNELANLEDSRKVIFAQWREALGIGISEPLPPFPRSMPPKHVLPDEDALLNAALTSNAQLKALSEEIKLAETLVKLAYKENVPDFDAGLGTNTRQKPWSLMPEIGLTLPVWRDKIGAQIASARAGEKESRSMLSAAKLELVITLAEKSFMWRELRRQSKLIETQLMPLATVKLQSSESSYTTGGSGIMEWIESANEILELKTLLSESTAREEIALSEIMLLILSRQPEETNRILNSK